MDCSLNFKMRLITLIANSLWILPLCLHYAVKSDFLPKSKVFQHDDSVSRVIFTNVSFQVEPIAINPLNYYEFVCNSEFFVDNSNLIEYIGAISRIAILLPRRFGKTLNLLMLKCFYEIPVKCVDNVCKPVSREETQAHQIFENGLLTTCEDTTIVKLNSDFQIKSKPIMAKMNKRPVLYFTFQRMTGRMMKDLKSIYAYIIVQIRKSYNEHYYLKFSFPAFNIYYLKMINPPEDENAQAQLIHAAVSELVTMIYRFFGKSIMLLMDEYDSILNTAFLTENLLPEDAKKDLVDFFGQFFNVLLKDNHCISKVVLTGIIDWKNADILSSLLQVSTATVNHNFPLNCYGISETDLNTIYQYFHENIENLSDSALDLKKYYDGYLFGDLNMKRYNPISIALYFKSPYSNEKRLKPYWGETGDISSILLQLIKFSNFATHFLSLILPNGIYEIQISSRYLLSLEVMKTISYCIQSASNLPPSEWYITSNADVKNIFLYLYATGYLTKNEQSTDTLLILQIPNQEVREVLWNNYHTVLSKQINMENNVQFRYALETFAPFLGEMVKTNRTNCSNLTKYFNLVLLELPPFTKTRAGEEERYYYASEAQIESTFSGVLDWCYNQLCRQEQHDFKKSHQFPDKRTVGRPDITVIYKEKITLFEIKLDYNFDHAYIQAMKYVHLYFQRSEYDEINQIKVIPFVAQMDKSVISNATICTRDDYNMVEAINPTIRNDLTTILRNTDISSECKATCIRMQDWTEWNCAAEKSQFDRWRTTVLEDCNEWLTKEMTYFRSS